MYLMHKMLSATSKIHMTKVAPIYFSAVAFLPVASSTLQLNAFNRLSTSHANNRTIKLRALFANKMLGKLMASKLCGAFKTAAKGALLR